MPAGITIYNDSGAIQVDGRGINFTCTGSGTVTTAANLIASGVNYGSFAVASFPVNANTLYAFRCDTAGVHVRRQWVTGSGTRNYRLWVLAPIGTTITWYRFELMSQSQSNGIGFDVYTETGQIAFSLGSKPLSIRELINVTRSYTGGTISLTSGRQYAIIPSAQLGWEDASVIIGYNSRGDPLYRVNTASIYTKNNGGSVTLTVDQRLLPTPDPTSAIDNYGQALIVDVTYL